MKLRSLLFALCITLSTPTVSLGAVTPFQKDGFTYRTVVSSSVKSFDPINSDNPSNATIVKNLFATLVTYNTKKNGDFTTSADIVPYLAENWHVSVDRKTYNFKIKSNVFFHNGRKLTAYDIKHTFERLANPKVLKPSLTWIFKDMPIKGLKKYQSDILKKVKEPNLEGVKVIDDTIFQLILDTPSPLVLKELTMPIFSIIPKEEIDKWGDDFGLERPIGSGPYYLASKSPDQVVLQKHEKHFIKDENFISTLVYRVVPKVEDEYSLFQKNELEQTDLPDDEIDKLFNQEKFNKFNVNVFETNYLNDRRITQIVKEPKLITSYIGIGNKKTFLKNQRVRQALNFAVNKYKIVSNALKYKAIESVGIFPEHFPGIKEGRLAPYQFNAQKARKMLYETGFTDFDDNKMLEFERKPVTLDFYYYNDTESEKVSAEIATDLKSVGLDVKLVKMDDFNKFIKAIMSGKADLYHFKANSKYADPDKFLTPLFDSKNIGTTNLSHFSNANVDKMLVKARNIVEDEFRYKFYGEIEKTIIDEAPWIFLYQPVKYVKVKPYVYGFQIHPVMQDITKYTFYGKEENLIPKKFSN